ncbi:MAG: hypothetical protein JXX14_04385 [Deltaproteobacteria bacterium]|nr:hypothetical protein [Deltaproteobacteria bacterium]
MTITVKLFTTHCVLTLLLWGCNLLSSGEDTPAPTPEKPTTTDTMSKDTAATDTSPAADTTSTDANAIDTAPKLNLTFPALDPSIGQELNKPEKMKSVKLYNDGMKFFREENYQDALEMLQAAIQTNPSNLLFRKDAACTLVKLNELDAAASLFREMTVTDDCPRCYVSLADAWEDKCFAQIKKEIRFKSLLKPAFEEVKKDLAESDWVTIVPWRERAFKLNFSKLPAKSDDGRNLALLRPKYENADHRYPRVFFQVIDVETDIVKSSQLIATPDEIKSLENFEKVEIIRERVEKRIRDGHKMMLGWKWTTIPRSEIPPQYREIKIYP